MSNSWKILFLSYLVVFSSWAPFAIADYYAKNYQPCGDTMVALWCSIPLIIIASIFTLYIFFIGLMKLLALLQHIKAKNIYIMIVSTGLFLITLSDIDPIALVNYQFLSLIPIIILAHYYIFNVIKKPISGIKPSVLSLALWLLVLICCLAIKNIIYNVSSNYSATFQINSTPVIVNKNDRSGKKKYQDEQISFLLPTDWVESPINSYTEGYSKKFTNRQNHYELTFSSSENYNQMLNKPYLNIDEYINTVGLFKPVLIDGLEGRQVLPRAGSENINSVVLISKDNQFIYTLTLKVGISPADVSILEVNAGKKLFAEILTSIKFKD